MLAEAILFLQMSFQQEVGEEETIQVLLPLVDLAAVAAAVLLIQMDLLELHFKAMPVETDIQVRKILPVAAAVQRKQVRQ